MPSQASRTKWINCTHPRQLKTANVRRIISVNAQLSRRQSTAGKAAPKRLKAGPDGPKRRAANNSKSNEARYQDEVDKVLAEREDEDESPLSEREATPESVPSLTRTESVSSDEVVEVGVVRNRKNQGNLKMNHTMPATAPKTPHSWSSRSRSNSPLKDSPQTLLDSGLLDPFSTGSVPISRDMNDLLLHLVFIMVPPKGFGAQQPWNQFCPVVSQWARTAIGPTTLPEHYISVIAVLSNSMLQYAVCGLAAAHVHFLKQRIPKLFESQIDPFHHRPMLIDCLYYQGKVMEELHKHLIGNDDFNDICTVVSTMCLLAMSIYFGGRDEIVVHINGFKNLVRERGGWGIIPLDVAQIYLCTIYLSAIWTSSVPPEPPRPVFESEYPNAVLIKETAPSLVSLGERFFASADALFLDAELLEVISQVQYITRYREYCLGHGYQVTAQQVEIFTLKRLDLEYRLMSRLFGNESATSGDPRRRAIEISLLIFSVVNLELLTTSAGPLRTLLKLLQASLRDPQLSRLWWGAHDILMWVFFMGAHICFYPKERLWFVYRLAQLLPGLGSHSWDDARLLLTGCFYVDRMYEESFREIWKEANALGYRRILA